MERILKFEKRRKRILWVYSIAFLLLIIACFITFYANRQLVKQSSTIKSTNKLIINLEKILSTLNDAESGVRGYLATKQSEFLLHYYGSKKLTDSLYNETKLLASDNPTQQERLNRLKETYERRLNLLSVLVKQFDNGVQQIGDSLINQMILSKGTMDVCRSEVALLQNEEKRLLTVRDENLKTNIVIINSLTIISLLIAFILIIFAYLTYLRENIARKLVLTEVYNYQDELKKKVVQLNKANAELIRIRSIEKFAATGRIARTIAHEVRNPLTNIDLAVDQLQTEVVVQPDESSTMLFDIIKRNSNRINQLISDLLNSTKFSEL
ncbi:MAG TPA: CHASE3 domain-containing protein, partial [Chitinophagaceae bacterium]|nr:CHASE3 domain-containing protein [Chitinophagaceae bacterium]